MILISATGSVHHFSVKLSLFMWILAACSGSPPQCSTFSSYSICLGHQGLKACLSESKVFWCFLPSEGIFALCDVELGCDVNKLGMKQQQKLAGPRIIYLFHKDLYLPVGYCLGLSTSDTTPRVYLKMSDCTPVQRAFGTSRVNPADRSLLRRSVLCDSV